MKIDPLIIQFLSFLPGLLHDLIYIVIRSSRGEVLCVVDVEHLQNERRDGPGSGFAAVTMNQQCFYLSMG